MSSSSANKKSNVPFKPTPKDAMRFNSAVSGLVDLLKRAFPDSEAMNDLSDMTSVCIGASPIALKMAHPILVEHKDAIVKRDMSIINKVLPPLKDMDLSPGLDNLSEQDKSRLGHLLQELLVSAHLQVDAPAATAAAAPAVSTAVSSNQAQQQQQAIKPTHTEPSAVEVKTRESLVKSVPAPAQLGVDSSSNNVKPIGVSSAATATTATPAPATATTTNTTVTESERREWKRTIEKIMDASLSKIGAFMKMNKTMVKQFRDSMLKQLTSDKGIQILKQCEGMEATLSSAASSTSAPIVTVQPTEEDIESCTSLIFNFVLMFNASSIDRRAGEQLPKVRQANAVLQVWLRQNYLDGKAWARFKELYTQYETEIKESTLFSEENLKRRPIRELDLFGIYDIAQGAPNTVPKLMEYIKVQRRIEERCRNAAQHVPEMVYVLVKWVRKGPLERIRKEMQTRKREDLPDVLFRNLFATLQEYDLGKEMMIVLNIFNNEKKMAFIANFFEEFAPILSSFMQQGEMFQKMANMTQLFQSSSSSSTTSKSAPAEVKESKVSSSAQGKHRGT